MEIKEYRIKSGVTMEEIKDELRSKYLPWNGQASYIHPDSVHSTFKRLVSTISVNIGFPEDLSTWDSYDHVLVLDEDFVQPYHPFYTSTMPSKFLERVITAYNEFMDSLSFLEEK